LKFGGARAKTHRGKARQKKRSNGRGCLKKKERKQGLEIRKKRKRGKKSKKRLKKNRPSKPVPESKGELAPKVIPGRSQTTYQPLPKEK